MFHSLLPPKAGRCQADEPLTAQHRTSRTPTEFSINNQSRHSAPRGDTGRLGERVCLGMRSRNRVHGKFCNGLPMGVDPPTILSCYFKPSKGAFACGKSKLRTHCRVCGECLGSGRSVFRSQRRENDEQCNMNGELDPGMESRSEVGDHVRIRGTLYIICIKYPTCITNAQELRGSQRFSCNPMPPIC